MEITYFVHGSTADNENRIATGWEQISLSPKGIEQTQYAARSINVLEYDSVYVSDLLRAIESAKILFYERRTEIIVDSRLRECNYGLLTRKPNHKLNYKEHIHLPFPNGESLYDVEMRIRNFLDETILYSYKRIAVVSHRAPQLAFEVVTKNIPWEWIIEKDWRILGNWQLGWKYHYK